MKNESCEGSGPHSREPEVRLLPTGADSNAILCRRCYESEIRYRRETDGNYGYPTQTPSWTTLKVYNNGGEA